MKRTLRTRPEVILLILVFALAGLGWFATLDRGGRSARIAGGAPPALVETTPVSLDVPRFSRPWTTTEPVPEEPIPAAAVRKIAQRKRNSGRADLMASLPFLLEKLRDDDVRGNGTRTMWYLNAHKARQDVEAALEGSLYSDDAQERQFAAWTLRRRSPRPSPRLIEVSMEALRNDGKKTRFHPFRRNAADAMSFFLKRGSSAWEPLLLALDSSDLQQRFLAAVALVYIDSQSAPALRIVPILVRQLRDNHIRNDAVLAAGSLYRMGRRVIPQLERSLRDADLQARTTLELVLLNLREPPRTASELARRRSMQRICHADPCYLMQRPGALVRYVAAFEDF